MWISLAHLFFDGRECRKRIGPLAKRVGCDHPGRPRYPWTNGHGNDAANLYAFRSRLEETGNRKRGGLIVPFCSLGATGSGGAQRAT